MNLDPFTDLILALAVLIDQVLTWFKTLLSYFQLS